ncbi:MAG: aldo/keto reductase, partial [Alphaproteobacteria bacterium]
LGPFQVSALAFGCMNVCHAYGASPSPEAAVRLLQQALDAGFTHFDTAALYGFGESERLVGRALKSRRHEFVLASKGGMAGVAGEDGVMRRVIDGRPEAVRRHCEDSLRRLDLDVIDLYYQHRVDTEVPIEDTIGAMAKLVEQGKVKAIGICEARPETIRRAHATHPLAAVQSEFSLMYRVEAEQIYATTNELGITFVAYSPLGRGILTDQYVNAETVDEDDPHYRHPRFNKDNFQANRELILRVAAYADKKGCSPAQLVLAWLIGRGDDIVTIPGTKRAERFDENVGAIGVELSPAEVEEISALVPVGAAAGERYPEAQMKRVFI